MQPEMTGCRLGTFSVVDVAEHFHYESTEEMPKPLFENSPVSSVLLPGISDPITLKGLIVVVGPNSSGKTNLLRDVHAAASGSGRDFVVAKEIRLREARLSTVDDYIQLFRHTGDIRP